MKRIFIIVLLLSFRTLANDSFAVYFKDEMEASLKFLYTYNQKMVQKAHTYHHKNKFVTAIIFPELLRYNYVQDMIETSSLELIYIEYGSQTADFSIGHFQMKPSFVENIEKYIEKYPASFYTYKKLIHTNKSMRKTQRKIRLERLKSLDWQLTYLHAFVAICDHKFKFLKWNTIPDKLRFYATCYNIGFQKKYEDILINASKKTFPHGPNYLGNQYSYASIACSYFLNPNTMK